MKVKQYTPIDIHKPVAPLWPDPLPPLTAYEAERAARRMWRYAKGETYTGKVHIGTGNRINWYAKGVLTVNPSRGWKHLIHELSHYFFYDANPGERPHSKYHARWEIKLTKEALKRGWLDGKLKKPEVSKPVVDPRLRKLALVEAGIKRWETKAKRAKTALAKLERKRRYYQKALAS
jgi:hypothetical protein